MREMFSAMEKKVIAILKRKQVHTLTEIADKVYDRHAGQMTMIPMDANVVISNTVSRINKKCERHQLPWFIDGVGGGRGGRTVWITSRTE